MTRKATALSDEFLSAAPGAARSVAERRTLSLEAGALQRAIFNSANFSSIATDAKGVIQIFNVGAECMLGYCAAEVVGKITPADISDPLEVIARARALSIEYETPITPGFEALVFKASRGIEDIYELTNIRKDGSRFPAVVSITALRDEQEAIIGYLLIGTDNTARKETEADKQLLDQRLHDQQFYTRSLIEASVDALVVIDPSGIIIDANRQMETLTESTRDELLGAPFKRCFTDPERAEACIKLALSEKRLANFELMTRARGGAETMVSLNCTTFYNRERKLQGVFAAARDITERKRDEALRDQIERVMCHDLRTPACNAINIARMLREEASLTEEQRSNLLCQFEQSGRNMLDTLNGSLDIYKIETGQYQLKPESLDCLAMVLEMTKATARNAWAANRRQKVLLDGHPPGPDSRCQCLGRPELLRSALQNLLKNALEASPPGAAVVVDISSDKGCRIEIRNKGVVPLEIRDRFFDKYATKGKASGTGLGTYSARLMVKAQGGDLSMRTSDEDNETVVTLRLPC
jgi:PAS domain S-box-containing protein